jgi:hypothetical protein
MVLLEVEVEVEVEEGWCLAYYQMVMVVREVEEAIAGATVATVTRMALALPDLIFLT